MKMLTRLFRSQVRSQHFDSFCTRLRTMHDNGVLNDPAFLGRLEAGRAKMYRAFARPWHVAGITLGLLGTLFIILGNPFETMPFAQMEAWVEFGEVASTLGIFALLGAIGAFYIFFNRCDELDLWFAKERGYSLGNRAYS